MGYSVTLSVPKEGYGQFNTATCWYASYRMLYAWKGWDTRAITTKLQKKGLDVPSLMRRGIFEEEFGTAMTALGLLGWKGITIYEQSPQGIGQILKEWGPMWVAFEWQGKADAGHAAVVVGYDHELQCFKVHNPYNRFEPGNVDVDWMKPWDFRAWIRSSPWAVQVCPKG